MGRSLVARPERDFHDERITLLKRWELHTADPDMQHNIIIIYI